VLERRLFEELARLLLISNLGLHFTAQRMITRARFIKKGCTFIDPRSSADWASSSICFHRSGVIALFC